jgi:hypothetical protein
VLGETSPLYQFRLAIAYHRGFSDGWDEGRVVGAQRIVLLQARKRFGAAPAFEARVTRVLDADRLERMAERLLHTAGWDDLLATP